MYTLIKIYNIIYRRAAAINDKSNFIQNWNQLNEDTTFTININTINRCEKVYF